MVADKTDFVVSPRWRLAYPAPTASLYSPYPLLFEENPHFNYYKEQGLSRSRASLDRIEYAWHGNGLIFINLISCTYVAT